MIVCPWFSFFFFFLGGGGGGGFGGGFQVKENYWKPFTHNTQSNKKKKEKSIADVNYICQMCIKLAYITIYFGLHLQYMLHICDFLLLLLVLFLASVCALRVLALAVFFFFAKKKSFLYSLFTKLSGCFVQITAAFFFSFPSLPTVFVLFFFFHVFFSLQHPPEASEIYLFIFIFIFFAAS